MNKTNTIFSYCTNNPFLFYHHSISPKSTMPLIYPTETHPGYEILYSIRGTVTYFIEGKEYVVESGDVIILKSNEVHKLSVDLSCGYERCVIQFSNEMLPSSMQISNDLIVDILESIENSIRVVPSSVVKKFEIDKLFLGFDNHAKQSDTFALAKFSADIISLFIALNSALIEISNRYTAKVSNTLIKQISDYIIANIKNKITINDIAKAVNFSPSRLSHLFCETMGFSLHKYVILKKVQHAQNLIKHGKSLTEVAIETGYQYYSTFYNNYKSLLGEPPSTENARKW